MIISEASEHDVQVAFAEELLEKEDFAGAATEAMKVLDELEPTVPTIAQASLTKGRAMMKQMCTKMALQNELPPREELEKAWSAYELSKRLNPECQGTASELANFTEFLRKIPAPDPPKQVRGADLDVLVVGAGAAGIGCAYMLTKTFGIDKSRVLLVERGDEVGETFRRWPAEMKFISPSFNQQGWTNSFDLNSIATGTSPAYSLHSEHPSGAEYAAYLAAIVKTHKMKVRRRTEVVSIRDVGTKELPLFSVEVRSFTNTKEETTETLSARYIVWAAGEFQYPWAAPKESKGEEEKKSDDEEKKDKTGLDGSELCLHNSEVRSWAKLPGDDFVVIGGYESGVDATFNLARAGKRCKLLASTPCWNVKTTDPSAELAPYTAARLRDVMAPGFSPKPQLFAPLRVTRVEKAEAGDFIITAEWKKAEKGPHAPLRDLEKVYPNQEPSAEGSSLVFRTPNAPVLCTGFEGSVAAAASHLFAFADDSDKKKGCLDGAPLLTENDESTKIPGVFLVGPTVSHGKHSFCFVYKFRQRFGIVASAICRGLGKDTRAAITECRRTNMYLDDFTCCTDTCGDVC